MAGAKPEQVRPVLRIPVVHSSRSPHSVDQIPEFLRLGNWDLHVSDSRLALGNGARLVLQMIVTVPSIG